MNGIVLFGRKGVVAIECFPGIGMFIGSGWVPSGLLNFSLSMF